jgi:hypothetical protein
MKGVIFKYTNKAGEEVKGVAFNEDQKPAFKDHKKALLRLLNEDYTFKTDEEGKKIIALKDFSCLTRVGFWD